MGGRQHRPQAGERFFEESGELLLKVAAKAPAFIDDSEISVDGIERLRFRFQIGDAAFQGFPHNRAVIGAMRNWAALALINVLIDTKTVVKQFERAFKTAGDLIELG